MSGLTARLVDAVLAVNDDTVPAAALERAAEVVLDGIGVMLAGSAEPLGVGRIVTKWVTNNAGTPESSVVAGGVRVPAMLAAFANGTMGHALDFDNMSQPRNHPMSPTLPAILALAEKYDLSGHDVLMATVVSFEVQGRLRLAATGLDTGKGLHKPGTIGVFGATAACGWLLKLTPHELSMALGIAGSRAGSLSINTGTMTKSCHSGHAARMGVECVELAQLGFTASDGVFDEGGFFDTFLGDRCSPELLVEGFGDPFRMLDPGVGFKRFPCNGNTHRAIECALRLRQREDFRLKDVADVEIVMPRLEYIDRPDPKTGLDGKFSLQYVTTLALLDGGISVGSFTDGRRFAADVAELLPKMRVRFDPEMSPEVQQLTAIVNLTTYDGRTDFESLQRLPGMVGVPLTREQLLDKFNGCSEAVVGHERTGRILRLIDELPGATSVRPLLAEVAGIDPETRRT